MFYKVNPISSSEATAEIVPYRTEDGKVNLVVYSENSRMKSHLDSLLMREAYILSPTKSGKGFHSDGVLRLLPYTLEYAQALPQVLSWSGYYVEFSNEVHKSAHYIDESIFKSVDPIRTNEKGERIVAYVPDGYIAMHTSGKTLAAGKWLNANIDKENADWVLVENPYQNYTPEQRQQALSQMEETFEVDYHPGAREEAYGEEYVEKDKMYKPQGKRLSEVFSAPEEPIRVPGSVPSSLPPGKVLYAPEKGLVIASEHWPLSGHENEAWYVFDGVEEDDDTKRELAEMVGISVPLITGLAGGVVQVPHEVNEELIRDLSSGTRLRMPGANDVLVEINPVREEKEVNKWLAEVSKTEENRAKVKRAEEFVSQIRARLNQVDESGEVSVDPSLAEDEIEGLYGRPGDVANFRLELYPHQAGIVQAMTDAGQYEALGGPAGWNGHFVNSYVGSGKTIAIAAAETVMRNRGHFKHGEQVTIITAPSKNVYVWQSEMLKATGQDVEIIGAGNMSRQDRIDQWEGLVHKARHGMLPHMVIVAGSKFRQERVDSDDALTEEEQIELGIDAKYMQLLSMGGKNTGGAVKGNHVSALVVDESAQYSNPTSSRHRSIMQVVESVYQGKGLVWTLSGTLSGNSAADTITELAFVNREARGKTNFDGIVNYYTMVNNDLPARDAKEVRRRIWVPGEKFREFFDRFRRQATTVSPKAVAGVLYGKVVTEDSMPDIGHTWGNIYNESLRKLAASKASNQTARTYGLISMMVGASVGAIKPARLMEYDLGMENMLQGLKSRMADRDAGDTFLTLKEYADIRDKIGRFQNEVTFVADGGVGRIPGAGSGQGSTVLPDKEKSTAIPVAQRDKVFESIFSEREINAMQSVLDDWDSPTVDAFVDGIDDYLKGQVDASGNKRVGVAGFSKSAMHAVYRRLKRKYGDNVLIQIVDGDTDAKEVLRIQDSHAAEKEKNVVTLVTAAGLYGLSLPADRSFRLTTWNSAKGEQYDGRFQRNAFQSNMSTVVAPKGILSFMRDLELAKDTMNQSGKRAVAYIDADDVGDEIDVKTLGESVFRALLETDKYKIAPRKSETNERE